MALEYGLTEEGYTAPRAADFLAVIVSAIEESWEITIDPAADVRLYRLLTVMADQLGQLGEAGQALYDGFGVGNASGLQLDNLCVLVGVTRNAATYSQATVTLTGTTGTIILAGSIVEGGGSDGRARWRVSANVTLAGGTGSGVVVAIDAGVVEADAAAIDAIVTPISGWTAVTNAAAATPGEARESDATLRRRRQASLQIAGSRSLNAIRAHLLAVDGVQAAVVVDNTSLVTATVEGLSLVAKSVGIVVYPATLTTAQKEEVVGVLYDHVPAGISCANGSDVVSTVTGGDGFGKVITFDYADEVLVNVVVTVTLDTGYELADVSDAVETIVADYFLALNVGDAARRLALGSLIYVGVDGVNGASITFNAVGADLTADATEILILDGNSVI